MERRVTSHTEEEEMNQRRSLLTLARKGDQKSIDQLFELYQVKVFSGDALKKKKLPSFPVKPSNGSGKGGSKSSKNKVKTSKVSIADAQSQKTGMKNTQSPLKEQSQKQVKAKIVQPSSQKSPKPTLQGKPGVKKASLPKKKSLGTQLKPQKLASAKKPRIAKKK
jgi:hypothetical protein